MVKFSVLKRLVFGLVGVAGVYGFIFLFSHWNFFWSGMPVIGAIAYILLCIGGLNWLVVALTGVGEKDLLYYLKFR